MMLALVEGVMAGVVIGAVALIDGAEDEAGAAGVIVALQAVSASGSERAAARPASLAVRVFENMWGVPSHRWMDLGEARLS
jgi:hypothetical protein